MAQTKSHKISKYKLWEAYKLVKRSGGAAAAVDDKHQTIVWAGVYEDSNESKHLPEALEGIEENCQKTGISKSVLKKLKITADTGYHSEENMKLVYEKGIEAYIPDKLFRKRDVRFSEVVKYKKKIAEWQPTRGKKYFTPEDFHYEAGSQELMCPAGKRLWLKTRNFRSLDERYKGQSYMGPYRRLQELQVKKQMHTQRKY